MKIAICVPAHIPPSDAWIAALDAEAKANDAQVIIVDDSDGKLGALPSGWRVFGYRAQAFFLGELYEDFARMFHKSSSCRVFGHVWAYKMGYDVVIGLDSDCIVKRHFVRDHVQFLGKDYGSGWFNPIGYPNYTRGYPYSQRGWPIVANMGLWENVLDINGKDRKDNEPKEIKIQGSTVPSGYFPFSGMNFAITREAVFGFLFLPNFNNGEDKFRRIDDIWGGYIFQKLMRKIHVSPMLGYPFVYHDTIVVPEEDAAEEEAMYKHEDAFISLINSCTSTIRASTTKEAFEQFAERFTKQIINPTFDELKPSVEWWVKVMKKYA